MISPKRLKGRLTTLFWRCAPAGLRLTSRQNCKKSNVKKCIFDYMASHIECRFKKKFNKNAHKRKILWTKKEYCKYKNLSSFFISDTLFGIGVCNWPLRMCPALWNGRLFVCVRRRLFRSTLFARRRCCSSKRRASSNANRITSNANRITSNANRITSTPSLIKMKNNNSLFFFFRKKK